MNLTDSGTAETSELRADAIVIGTGAAGLCAALTLGFAGASVLVFEQLYEPGGMTNHIEGLFAVESKMQKKLNVGLTLDEAFRIHMHETHWLADARLVRKFMERSGPNIQWLEDLGVQFSGIFSMSPFTPRVWHQLVELGEGGLVKPLYRRLCELENVRVFLETPVQSMVMENERAAGVVVRTKDGDTLTASAEVVVIASGGYQDNKEWVDRYCKTGYIRPIAASNMTGGPIQMAWDVGADAAGLGVTQSFVVVPGEELNSELQQAGYQPHLFVNRDGRRFCDESVLWNFSLGGNALAIQPGAFAWCIFDHATKESLKQPNSLLYVCASFFDILAPLSNIDAEIERGIRERKAFRVDSLEKLGVKIGVETEDLSATVEEYNRCVDAGYDSVFGKDRRYLHEIRTPPFYAVRLGLATFITNGGIRVNDRLEVLTKDSVAIEGLYAAGCCVGGLVGDTYEVSSTGSSCGFSVATGQMAGESALEYLGK